MLCHDEEILTVSLFQLLIVSVSFMYRSYLLNTVCLETCYDQVAAMVDLAWVCHVVVTAVVLVDQEAVTLDHPEATFTHKQVRA